MKELEFSIELAKKCGEIIRSNFKGNLEVSYKGENNLVTNIDKFVDNFVREEISAHFRGYSVVTEEGKNDLNGPTDEVFIVDPIDGTTNFVKGYPYVSISIAFVRDSEVQCGVVYNPISDELYYAEKGKGAFKNGITIRVSTTERLSSSLLSTGFPYDFSEYSNFPQFESLFRKSLSIRVNGSAALDLATVGEGVFDCYWEKGLSIWDIAAGSLIVTEAGGSVTDFLGGTNYLQKGEIVAGNPAISRRVLEVLNSI
jgi:myo-inositol-1(or 4)-monophosphatase